MEKITFNENHRPKSSRICQRALTESNDYYNNISKKNYYFPNIKDRITKNSCNKSHTTFRNFPGYTCKNFFMSSSPFYFSKNKKSNNEFCICYNGGPRKKICFSLKKKNLNLNMSNIYGFSHQIKLRHKYNKCPNFTTSMNNKNEKIKYNYLYDHLEEEKNSEKNSDKIADTECNNFNKKEDNDEKKIIDNYFKKYKKEKFRFHKIQIHNNCKPFLVDDYRYYAEKYL